MDPDDTVDPRVCEYVTALQPDQRTLFERIHRLVLDACPTAQVVLSYKMPTYRVGKRRLHVGAWAHGISIYGWKAQGDGGFTQRHPELQTSTGTIQLRPHQAAAVSDDEIRTLARAALTS
jgi:uncharacterized protein YdhG (YjbR/CyaY superfamily)